MHQNLDFPLQIVARGGLVHTPKHTFSVIDYAVTAPGRYLFTQSLFSIVIYCTWRVATHHNSDFLLQITALSELQHTIILFFIVIYSTWMQSRQQLFRKTEMFNWNLAEKPERQLMFSSWLDWQLATLEPKVKSLHCVSLCDYNNKCVSRRRQV